MIGDAREIAKAMTDGMVAMSLLKAEVERLKALVRSQAKALTAAERALVSLIGERDEAREVANEYIHLKGHLPCQDQLFEANQKTREATVYQEVQGVAAIQSEEE